MATNVRAMGGAAVRANASVGVNSRATIVRASAAFQSATSFKFATAKRASASVGRIGRGRNVDSQNAPKIAADMDVATCQTGSAIVRCLGRAQTAPSPIVNKSVKTEVSF